MNYNDFPIIQMKTALEQEEWFKLSNGSIMVNLPESSWMANGCCGSCNEALLSIFYKDVECKVHISDYRKKIQTRAQFPDYCYQRRVQKTANISKAVRNIRETLIECTGTIDKELVREAEAKRIRIIKLAQRQDIINKLGVTITPQEYDEFGLCFNMSKKHRLSFYYVGEPGKEEFAIRSLNGTYSLDSIKRLIDYLNVCPEAVADRLLNGK